MAKEWAKAFYNSKEWQAVRQAVLMRDKYLCQKCHTHPAEEVHHKIYLTQQNIYDESISLNAANLISLCRDCHQNEHKHSRTNQRLINKDIRDMANKLDTEYIFDANGQLVPRE